MPLNISIGMWNINGLNDKVLGNKSHDQDFVRHITSHDLIFLTETWSNTFIDIPDFKTTISHTAPPRTNNSGRLSGGITLLYKNRLKEHITTMKKSKNTLWCKISKNILNSNSDLFLCGIYIPPENSKYFENSIFDELEKEINTYSSKGDIMLTGDFNARTSTHEDFISNDGNKHLNDLDRNNMKCRENFDNKINNHGKQIIEICKIYDLQILNGRTKGDSFGRPTFHGKNGTSVVDYTICSVELLDNINHFIVRPPNCFSDHSPITTWINTKQPIDRNSTRTNNEKFSQNFHINTFRKPILL